MEVYKFGGASVKDAAGIHNVVEIIKSAADKLVVVISAMGKMTNALEVLADSYFHHKREACDQAFEEIKAYHNQIVFDLFGSATGSLGYNKHLRGLQQRLTQSPSMHYDFEYDQIVSYGELLSTAIVADFLTASKINCKWMDSRTLLKTDDIYREANVNWDLTTKMMQSAFNFGESELYLTQGFLGGTMSNLTTTLGREGSDYTAAIIAHVMDGKRVTIWKDVSGVLSGDPRWYADAVKLSELTYNEAIELTFYGAQVIHPKTLKPLQNKEIPLYVRSFIEPSESGTMIHSRVENGLHVPAFVLKQDQYFVTVNPKDFSFIMEDKLIDIITIFKKFRIKINLMQSSALNFSACFDNKRESLLLLDELGENFTVRYNQGVDLLTIRQYTQEVIDKMIEIGRASCRVRV